MSRNYKNLGKKVTIMSHEGDVLQIAFMVDLQSYKTLLDSELACQKVANQIRLSSLKLLTYFCHSFSQHTQCKKSSKNLRWGYTFYNSCSLASPNLRSDFKEFNLRNFDAFENEVEDNLEHEKTMEEGSVAKGGRSGCEAMKYGLMNLSNDFPWGRPEILSPVRPTRQTSKVPKKTQPVWKNFAFVFSRCPKAPEDVMQFLDGCGKEQSNARDDIESGTSIKAQDILNSITTPSLLRELCSSKRMRIFFVDLIDTFGQDESVESLRNKSPRNFGYKIFDDVLQTFSGRVLPLGAILQRGSPTLSCILPIFPSSCKQKGDAESGKQSGKRSLPHLDALVPFSSLADHVVGRCNLSNAVAETGGGTQLVFLTGSSRHTCFLETNNMINHGETLNHRLCGHEKWEKNSQLPPVVIVACGTLDRGALPLNYLSNTDVYVCTANTKCTSEPLFCNMLLELSKQSLLLLVDFSSDSRNSCWRAVLQPLTSVSATLTVIKPDHMLFVEKLLASKLITEEPSEDMPSFLDRTVSHLVGGATIPSVPSSSQSGDTSTTIQHVNKKDARVLSSMLEPWYVQGCRQSTILSVMEALKEGSTGPNSEELKTIRKLQKQYRCSNTLDPTQKKEIKDDKSREDQQSDHETLSFLKNNKKYSKSSSRSSFLVEEAKRKNKEKLLSEKSPSKEEKKTEGKTAEVDHSIAIKDFKDDEELVSHLKEHYQKVLDGNLDPINYAHTAFTIVSHFYKEGGKDDPQASTIDLMSSLLMNNKTLKASFTKNDVEKKQQVIELQAQIVLHMEQDSFVAEVPEKPDEKHVKEIAKMMNSMSLAADDGVTMQKFLKSLLLDYYSATIPKALAFLYDELGQHAPESLPSLFSPSSQEEDEKPVKSVASVLSATSSVRSECLFSEDSMDPWSVKRRSRRVTRHSSVGDMASSRQIMVQVARQQKSRKHRSSKKQKQEKLTRAASASYEPIVVAETVEKKVEEPIIDDEDAANEMKKVRRNLFMGALSGGSGRLLERRQSVAVMENVADTIHSPSKQKVLKTSRVAETPEHKQAAKSLREKIKMEKLSQRMSKKSEVMVVEESPEKAVKIELRKSPRRLSLAPVLQRKRSFYDPSKKSRNVEKYRTNTSEFKSPVKVASDKAKSILFSQFGSPSPGRKVCGSPKISARRSPRLFSPERTANSPHFETKITPRRSAGVKKRLLGLMYDSPKKSPRKSPQNVQIAHDLDSDVIMSTPTKTPSKAVVPNSCSKTPQRVIWSEPIEMGPHTPRKTPDKHDAMSGKKYAIPVTSPYFTRAKTPKKGDPGYGDNAIKCLTFDSGGCASTKDISNLMISPSGRLAMERKIITPRKAVTDYDPLKSPQTPRSILKCKSASLLSPRLSGASPRSIGVKFAKKLCLDAGEMQNEVIANSKESIINVAGKCLSPPQEPVQVIGSNFGNKSDIMRTPVGAKCMRKPSTPRLFGDDWGKTTPDKFEGINLDGIMPFLENSPVPLKATGTVGDITPERVLSVKADITPNSKPPNRTPDSFDKWKRTKRRNSVQQAASEFQAGAKRASSENSDENKSPQLKRKVRKHRGWESPRGTSCKGSMSLGLDNEEDVGIKELDDMNMAYGITVVSGRSMTTKECRDSVVLLTPCDSMKYKIGSTDVVERENSKSLESEFDSGKCHRKLESLVISPESVFTPQRFTRGLSKETGLSPQVFTAMSTKSPRKKLSTQSTSSAGKGSGKRKRNIETTCISSAVGAQSSNINQEKIDTPTKRRRVVMSEKRSMGLLSDSSPCSQLQSISSQVSCPEYFSSENEEVFLTSNDQEFRYIDETTCGFSSDTSFTGSQKATGTPSSLLHRSLSQSGVQSGVSHEGLTYSGRQGASNDLSRGQRKASLRNHSSGSLKSNSTGSRLSGQDEESTEALSVMSGNIQSPCKTYVQHKNLTDDNVLLSPSHHRVEALRKATRLPASPTFTSPSKDKVQSPSSSGTKNCKTDEDSPKGVPKSAKKYSPNITAKALAHLLQSPILKPSDNFALASCFESDVTLLSETDPKPETKRSRRSLYRTKTNSAM